MTKGQMAYKTFEKKFIPIEHENTATGNPILLETYGEELSTVQNTDYKHVWTVVEGDTGDLYIIAGYHLVNRLNYIVTTNPWITGEEHCRW